MNTSVLLVLNFFSSNPVPWEFLNTLQGHICIIFFLSAFTVSKNPPCGGYHSSLPTELSDVADKHKKVKQVELTEWFPQRAICSSFLAASIAGASVQ